MTPRDYTAMIGETFYSNYGFDIKKAHSDVKDISWPDCVSMDDFQQSIRAHKKRMFRIT
jgi:hypothetical protein